SSLVSSFCSLPSRCPLRPTLFPSTTLFRSEQICRFFSLDAFFRQVIAQGVFVAVAQAITVGEQRVVVCISHGYGLSYGDKDTLRSEEHTSQLQPRENHACRLRLEKTKPYRA